MTAARRRLPPGRTPWDPLIGFRVGAWIGALLLGALGGVAAGVTGVGGVWLVVGGVVIGAVIGGVIGYRSERRKVRRGQPHSGASRP